MSCTIDVTSVGMLPRNISQEGIKKNRVCNSQVCIHLPLDWASAPRKQSEVGRGQKRVVKEEAQQVNIPKETCSQGIFSHHQFKRFSAKQLLLLTVTQYLPFQMSAPLPKSPPIFQPPFASLVFLQALLAIKGRILTIMPGCESSDFSQCSNTSATSFKMFRHNMQMKYYS